MAWRRTHASRGIYAGSGLQRHGNNRGYQDLWIERKKARDTHAPRSSFPSLSGGNPFVRRSKERRGTRRVNSGGGFTKRAAAEQSGMEWRISGEGVRERTKLFGNGDQGTGRRAPLPHPPFPIAKKRGFKANTKAVDKKFRPVKTVVSPVERHGARQRQADRLHRPTGEIG